MTPVEIARTYLGTMWVHQGRARRGIDCVGLLVAAFSDYGIQDRTDYSRDPSGGVLEANVREQFGDPVAVGSFRRPVQESSIRIGDVLVMAFPFVARHVGIVADHPNGLSLIHTDRSFGAVTEHRLDDRWLPRIRFVHRIEASA